MSKGPLDGKLLLDYADVARILGWGRDRAAKWVKAGVIPSVADPETDSDRRWVRRPELERWLTGDTERAS